MYRVAEAKAMVEAVRRNHRIVQMGTQHRSADHIAEAAKDRPERKDRRSALRPRVELHEPPGASAGPGQRSAGRPELGCMAGPAPRFRLTQPSEYRSFMDYTNGIISDYGNHRFDSVHQIMGVDSPLKVSSSGMRFDKTTRGRHLDLQRQPTNTRVSS